MEDELSRYIPKNRPLAPGRGESSQHSLRGNFGGFGAMHSGAPVVGVPFNGRGRGRGRGSANGRGVTIPHNWRSKESGGTRAHQQGGIRSQRYIGIDLKILEELSRKDSSAILTKIGERKEAFMELLKSPIDKLDIYPLLIKILASVCQSSFDSLKLKLLLDVCNSNFLIYLQNYLINLSFGYITSSNKLYWDNQTEFWENLILFFECVTNVSPSTAVRTCRALIETTTKVCLQGLNDRNEFKLSDEYEAKLNELRSTLTESEKEVEVKQEVRKRREDDDVEPPNNFRELSVVPTSANLLEQEPFVRPNIVDGAYRDLEQYMDVQYRLLREDCYGPVREGIRQFIQHPTRKKFDSVRIFRNVTFVEPYITNEKFGYLVQLDSKAQSRFRNTNWEHSKRFIYGSLLLFTKDNCKSFIMATVLDHVPRLLAVGKISVSLVDKSIGMEICLKKEKYTMIESEVYFEPYLLVLNAMKDPRFPGHLSMSKYIVNVEPTPRLPSYLQPERMYKVLCYEETDDDVDTFQEIEEVRFVVADFKTWPSSRQLGLNESQYEACKLALTHEFAVIQGPPGTGKTYLGAKVAKILIQNLPQSGRRWCLLVICYTNHALDQFLEALLPVTTSIVRIGNQSRNKAMDEFNISNKRKNCKYTGNPFWEEKNKLKAIRERLKDHQGRICSLQYEVLSYDSVNRYVDEVKKLSMFYRQRDLDPLHQWLFEYLNYDVEQATMEEGDYSVNFNFDEDESRQRKFEVVLDDFDDDFDVDLGAMGLTVDIKASFSLEKALKEIEDLKKEHFIVKTNDEAFNIQEMITILNAKIQLYKKMSVHRGQNRNPSFNARNPRQMPILDRWLTYFRWSDVIAADLMKKIVPLQNTFVRAAATYEEARMVLDLNILRDVRVIGMTTSAAARMRKLLISLAAPIVIVEEAAEVLEQHIITSLTKDTQHLILIGDHQQLRPSAAHMKMARHYNIEISLFERMIMNNIHSQQLSVQHRMRPEIAALICPHIYRELINHPSVSNFPAVRGMTSNLFFLSHDYLEVVTDESSSKSNPKEADIVLGLANYLIQQDYSPEDVTILSAYSGQMFYMRKERSKYPNLKNVKITVVDNYQGEESKIILLSLVRNNHQDKIGFLGIENRICVALSRAREGFYLFGNIDILMRNSRIWDKIAGTLEESGSLGKTLRLRCESHRDFIMISSAADFDMTPEGGCMMKCSENLPCGHQCPLVCHGYDRGHLTTKCQEKCERVVCESGHVCPLMCAVKCEPCKVPINKVLKCSHTMRLACSTEIDDPSVKCDTMVPTIHPDCGHEVKKLCHLEMKYLICMQPCIFRVESCGHQCQRTCHPKEDPHHLKYACTKNCSKAKAGCTAGLLGDRGDHQCNRQCHEPCDPCIVEVDKKRKGCKHSERVPCNTDVDLTSCANKCSRSLPCGHFCKNKCGKPCGGCKEMVTKTIKECGHTVKVECSTVPTRLDCTQKCERILRCGHPCTELCNEACEDSECLAELDEEFDSPCGHKVRLPCSTYQEVLCHESKLEDECLRHCKHPCNETLLCGHQCRGTCKQCRQGRLHAPCKQVCHQMNICGHQCKEPCNQVCPPCKVRCQVRCPHSQCNKLCGDICPPCQEECSRRCPHGACSRRCGEPCSCTPCSLACALTLPCGHPCHGLCGEPCPAICRQCKPDTFPKDFLGDDFADDAKFVQLQDCNHVLEVEDMDNLMMADKETISIKTCPFCRKPIINTPRYKDLINKTIAMEINPIKERVKGTKKQIDIKFKEILEKVISTQNKYPKGISDWNKILKNIETLQHGQKRHRVSLLTLNMLSIRLEIKEMIDELNMQSDYIPCSELSNEIGNQIFLISAYVNENKRKISQQQQKDIGNEIKRLHSMIQLKKIISKPEYKMMKTVTEIMEAFAEAEKNVLGWRPFNEREALACLEKLQKTVNLSGVVTMQERAMIVKAIGLKAGHWYKCPNGHPYCIDACGGATHEAVCNECGAIIGGIQHRLRADNAHAPEIDGSRFAAWSEQYNNMANFQL